MGPVVPYVGPAFRDLAGGGVPDGRVGAGDEDFARGDQRGDRVVHAWDVGFGHGCEAGAGGGGVVVDERFEDWVIGHEAPSHTCAGAIED